MTQALRLFDLPSPVDLTIQVARELATILREGRALSRTSVAQVFATLFGGTDADGCWSQRDVHIAVELAQLLWLRDDSGFTLRATSDEAEAVFADLDARLFNRANRSEEQVALDQFSTPPRLAWLAARGRSSPERHGARTIGGNQPACALARTDGRKTVSE